MPSLPPLIIGHNSVHYAVRFNAADELWDLVEVTESGERFMSAFPFEADALAAAEGLNSRRETVLAIVGRVARC